MKRIALLYFLFLAVGCSKKDIHLIKNYQKKNQCLAVSVNAAQQQTDDFFAVKTFDRYGKLTHLKTQIRGVSDLVYLYDYAVTYSDNKAIFKGSTKAFIWFEDNPPSEEDPEVPPDPNAPRHSEEQVDLRDTRDFEMIFDRKTRFPLEVRYVNSQESLLKLAYDHHGFLSKVNNYNVTTDQRGNILSILTPPETEPYYYGQQLGVYYHYSTRELAKGTRQYYETPNIVIHPMYSILEILNWGPFQPDLERTGVFMQHAYGDEYYPVQPTLEVSYSNHRYDQRGNLVSYMFDGNFWQPRPYPLYSDIRQVIRSIDWQCGEDKIKGF